MSQWWQSFFTFSWMKLLPTLTFNLVINVAHNPHFKVCFPTCQLLIIPYGFYLRNVHCDRHMGSQSIKFTVKLIQRQVKNRSTLTGMRSSFRDQKVQEIWSKWPWCKCTFFNRELKSLTLKYEVNITTSK